ncbi:hypothetical protein QUF90_20395 [Desulfococcaceae bacterium HSG9]|nr:hypothetical protein [Desulfococcaceae bacterium HSG9]
MAEIQKTFFRVIRFMEHIETGCIISAYVCQQFTGADNSPAALKLKPTAFIRIFAKGGHHFTRFIFQPAAGSITVLCGFNQVSMPESRCVSECGTYVTKSTAD